MCMCMRSSCYCQQVIQQAGVDRCSTACFCCYCFYCCLLLPAGDSTACYCHYCYCLQVTQLPLLLPLPLLRLLPAGDQADGQ